VCGCMANSPPAAPDEPENTSRTNPPKRSPCPVNVLSEFACRAHTGISSQFDSTNPEIANPKASAPVSSQQRRFQRWHCGREHQVRHRHPDVACYWMHHVPYYQKVTSIKPTAIVPHTSIAGCARRGLSRQ
jgi:hypothetical protein